MKEKKTSKDKAINKRLETLEEEFRVLKKQFDKFAKDYEKSSGSPIESAAEEYDGEWYSNHGHGD
jgi:DNA anti-recombination protein RmuC